MTTYVQGYDKVVVRWLVFVMVLVVGMIVLGGATRLTNSGLSITEWKPVTGALWPSNAAEWTIEFDKYKQTTEYAAEHPDMGLAGFKFIYFMEWAHRQLGRLIGVAYLLPLLYFTFKRRLSHDKIGFYAVLILIGVQGAIGWWMVESGFQGNRIDVAPYRLATHLGMAFIILALLLWLALRERGLKKAQHKASLFAAGLAGLVFLQIVSGAFVAGNHAGNQYNDWPLMNGEFFPSAYMQATDTTDLHRAAHPMIEGIATTQFNHRILAYLIFALTIWAFVRFRKIKATRGAVTMLTVFVFWQVGLGIITLIKVAPFGLSILHQMSSIAVFLAAIFMVWTSRLTPSES